MRVLLISHSLVTRSNHCLPAAIARHPGVELHVLAPDRWPEESRDVRQEVPRAADYHVHVSRVLTHRYHPNLFLYGGALAAALCALRPQIVDLHEEPFSAAAAQTLALRAALTPQSRFTFYSWQNIQKRYPPPFGATERLAFRAAPAASAATDEVASVLRAKGYAGALLVNPPGVDARLFRPLPELRAATRARFGIDPEAPLLGYLGRLTPEKGVADLLAALALLPDARLLLVGGGDRAWAEQQARAAGVLDRTVFAGALERTATPAFFAAIDALAVPSRTTATWKEQFGRVIAEAALCGVPVIGSDSGAIPHVIGPGGLVVPEQDAPALASAARRLLTDPTLRAQLGAAGRARALREFTWEQVGAARVELYQKLLAADVLP